MTFEIILKDGTSIFPMYAPEHKEAVIAFYQDKLDKGLIIGWGVVR